MSTVSNNLTEEKMAFGNLRVALIGKLIKARQDKVFYILIYDDI